MKKIFLFSALFLFPLFIFAAAPTSGLVGYWSFDEGSGTTVGDSSGNGNTGTLISGTTWTTGKVGSGAIQFDGTNDYINAGSGNSINASGELTISTWVYIDDVVGEKPLVSNSSNLNHDTVYNLEINTNKVWFVHGTNNFFDSSIANLVAKRWYHVAIVRSGSTGSWTVKFYIDGALDKSVTTAFNPTSSNNGLKIGRADSALFAGGTTYGKSSLDEVRIYNRALSAQEISDVYTDTGGGGSNPPPPPPQQDTTAPTFSSISSGIPTISGTTITWSTNELANDQVEYGLTSSYGANTAVIPTLTTSHSQSLTSLQSNTVYHFRVKSTDAAGNLATSGDNTFTTTQVVATPLITPPTPPSSTPSSASSLSQYGITWTFDKPYQYGTYANGDYWVVGPVTITSMTPAFSGGQNGWEINPVNSDNKQGFDSRADLYSASLVPALPYTAQPGQSVVKSISYSTCNYWNGPCLQTVAVLTVVNAVPVNNGQTLFRPPYVGTNKTTYSTANLQTNLLPSLAPVGNPPTLASVLSANKYPQFDHEGGVTGIQLRPKDNLPGYGGNVALAINSAVSRLTLNDSISAKMPALIAVVQGGIDRYYAVLSGQKWPAGGGHEPGRKLSIAFAALMLDDSVMKQTVSQSTFFSENLGIQTSIDGHGLFGFYGLGFTATETEYWQYVVNPPGQYLEYKDPYGYIDGGSNIDYDIDGYQLCCLSMPWKSEDLMLRLMPSMQSFWGNTALFMDYINRYVTTGTRFQPDLCAPPDPADLRKNSNQWTKYGITWGSNGQGGCIKDTNSADGIGRFPSYNGKYVDTGYYDDPFVRALWTAYAGYVSLPPIVPPPATPPSFPPIIPPILPPPITPPIVPPVVPPVTPPVIPPVVSPTIPGIIPPVVPPTPQRTTPSISSGQATLSLTRTLSVGSSGTDVTQLQNYLTTLGYFPPNTANGNYGTLTKQAVQKYQCQTMSLCTGDEGTTGYGMVGRLTRQSLSGGNTPPSQSSGVAKQSTLTQAQRDAIQKQIDALLVLVQQLILQLKKLRGV